MDKCLLPGCGQVIADSVTCLCHFHLRFLKLGESFFVPSPSEIAHGCSCNHCRGRLQNRIVAVANLISIREEQERFEAVHHQPAQAG